MALFQAPKLLLLCVWNSRYWEMQVGAGIFLHVAAHLKLNESREVLSKELSGGGNICCSAFWCFAASCLSVCAIPG